LQKIRSKVEKLKIIQKNDKNNIKLIKYNMFV